MRETAITKTWADSIVSSNEDASTCGDWSYSLTMGDGSPLDARAFSSGLDATKDFVVVSSNEDMVMEHTLLFTAWQGGYDAATDIVEHSFKVTIVDQCLSTAISVPQFAD